MRIFFCILLLLGSHLSQAVDLNAPASKPVTVATELSRGADSITYAKLKDRLDVVEYTTFVWKTINANKQRNTDTDAFVIGICFTAWLQLDENISGNFVAYDHVKIAETQSLSLFTRFRLLQNQIGLSDEDLCMSVGMGYYVRSLATKMREWDSKIRRVNY